ncbi:MAG: epoxyqueuosine reductase QueH, partial [Lachnospiraceae bacterium]|nr:epoxyqueuosine reductase QueH [Lachnospiraceae bacterium]
YYRSTELAKEYGLYRQDYCGCVFSKQEREQFQDLKSAEKSAEKSGKGSTSH